ncbi:MAG: DegT/DnrJ/EryC1/StrS family aminotransferase [Allosphingosinicella sp.]
MTIPILNLAAAYEELRYQIDQAVARVVSSGWYVGGPELRAFEDDYAAYCGAAHCVGVANGLDALHLTLRAMDVVPGDEVIVSSNSYIATLLAVDMAGAKPVMVEPDPATHNLDPSAIEAAITPRTRVVLPTHLYGQPADLDPILDVVRRHGLKLLEDAAQAHGAAYKGRRLGGHGDAVAWSFYPTKNLGAMGDAGAVTTNDPEIARRVAILGNYGSVNRYVNEAKGVNSRLDPLQAAVLSVKLKYLDEWNERRSAIAAFYQSALHPSGLVLPHVPNWSDPAWHLFVVRSPDRSELQKRLAEAGVQTQIHYPIPPHLQKAYEDLPYSKGDFPIAEMLADEVLSIPIGPHLSIDQARRVADLICERT